jgi:hypothetical protein
MQDEAGAARIRIQLEADQGPGPRGGCTNFPQVRYTTFPYVRLWDKPSRVCGHGHLVRRRASDWFSLGDALAMQAEFRHHAFVLAEPGPRGGCTNFRQVRYTTFPHVGLWG